MYRKLTKESNTRVMDAFCIKALFEDQKKKEKNEWHTVNVHAHTTHPAKRKIKRINECILLSYKSHNTHTTNRFYNNINALTQMVYGI